MRTFLLTRRPLIPLLFAAILVIVLCRYADAPYAIASLNLALDTPMTFLIPGVLGATAALLSHSSTPDMEQVATPRLAQHRTILLAAVVLTQWVYLLGAAWAMHRFASVDVLPEITAQLWWATVFYQGICILSAAAFTSVKMWILPLIMLTIPFMFGYAPNATPYWWNVLLTVHPFTSTLAVVLLAAGLIATRTCRQGFLEPRA